jgi:hypothetical protein
MANTMAQVAAVVIAALTLVGTLCTPFVTPRHRPYALRHAHR